MFPATQIPAVANGNILPGRFLTGVAGPGNFLLMVQASSPAEPIFGVSGRHTRGPSGTVNGDTFNAIAGDSLSYHGPLQIAELELGGNVTNMNVLLTTDAQGRGVALAPADGNTRYYGAIALRSGSTGEFIPVYVLPPTPTV